MKNIQGRVGEDTINALVALGTLRNPNDLEIQVTNYRMTWNHLAGNLNKAILVENKPSFWGGKAKDTPKEKPLPTYGSNLDFIKGLKRRNLHVEMPDELSNEKDYIIDLWHIIQDVRCVLEVRCVAKNSQGGYVIADKDTFVTLKRVLDNKEIYLNL